MLAYINKKLYLCRRNRIYMILYFSATGNSLAVARQLADRLNERLMLLTEAVQQDWTAEKRIGQGNRERHDSLFGPESDCGQV